MVPDIQNACPNTAGLVINNTATNRLRFMIFSSQWFTKPLCLLALVIFASLLLKNFEKNTVNTTYIALQPVVGLENWVRRGGSAEVDTTDLYVALVSANDRPQSPIALQPNAFDAERKGVGINEFTLATSVILEVPESMGKGISETELATLVLLEQPLSMGVRNPDDIDTANERGLERMGAGIDEANLAYRVLLEEPQNMGRNSRHIEIDPP